MNFRIGHGYDVHAFRADRALWLGGVLIPHTHGLDGHSDADVLLHAICDALLGAAALGDIGQLFPNTDAKWAGADSKDLLCICVDRLAGAGYAIGNIDATLIMEAPKVMKHAPAMRAAIAERCQLQVDQVNIKATTGEGMGFVGRREGAEAHAVALVYKTN